MFWRLLQEQSQKGSEAAQKFRQPLRSGREFVTHVKTYPMINMSEGEASEYILFPLPSTLISEYQQFKEVHQESDLGANISQGFIQSFKQVGKGTHHFHLLSFSPNHCFTFSSHSYSPGSESTSKTLDRKLCLSRFSIKDRRCQHYLPCDQDCPTGTDHSETHLLAVLKLYP